MSLLQERMKREQQRREDYKKSHSNSGGNFPKTDNWFKWTKNEHTVRLVGDFIIVHSHWIGPSPFNPVKLFDEKLFVGEDKLPYQMNCGTWDIEKEEDDNSCECLICKIRKVAGDILYSEEGKALDEKDKKFFKDLKYKCDAKTRYFFNCIDRENPYVNVEEKIKGYKIIEVPYELMDGIIALSDKLKGVDIASIEDGIDLTIRKEGGGGAGKVKYSVLPVYDGMSILKSPLTDEERAMKVLDLKLMCGKKLDQERLFEKLNDDIKCLLDDSSDTSKNEDAPF